MDTPVLDDSRTGSVQSSVSWTDDELDRVQTVQLDREMQAVMAFLRGEDTSGRLSPTVEEECVQWRDNFPSLGSRLTASYHGLSASHGNKKTTGPDSSSRPVPPSAVADDRFNLVKQMVMDRLVSQLWTDFTDSLPPNLRSDLEARCANMSDFNDEISDLLEKSLCLSQAKTPPP